MKTILVDAYETFVLKDKTINQDLYKLLETFPNRKIIVTNANDEQMDTLGITNMPYEVFTLKHNPDKTDHIYFQKLLWHYQLQTADVVYFEHNREAVQSAESLGITSHHYDEDKKDLVALREFLEKTL